MSHVSNGANSHLQSSRPRCGLHCCQHDVCVPRSLQLIKLTARRIGRSSTGYSSIASDPSSGPAMRHYKSEQRSPGAPTEHLVHGRPALAWGSPWAKDMHSFELNPVRLKDRELLLTCPLHEPFAMVHMLTTRPGYQVRFPLATTFLAPA